MEETEYLIVNRAGEFVPFSDDDLDKPITTNYLQLVIENLPPNRPLYIDPVRSKRDIRSLQTMIVLAKKRVCEKVATFKVDHMGREFLGFINTDINEGSIIV